MSRKMLPAVLIATAGLLFWALGCDTDGPGEADLLIEGLIVVQPQPVFLDAHWTLSGPRGYNRESYGQQMLEIIFPGTYTVSWEEQTGWIAPPDSSVDVLGPGTTTFTGTYVPE